MRRTRAGTYGNGSIYRPKSHKGTRTPFYWLKYRLPGMRKPKREPTNPRTSDEAEARRQLHARMGESSTLRVQREVVEDLTVNDLLDLYVLDCEDKAQPIQTGRVEPWRHALGHARAVDVRRDHLDDLCRRWRRTGPTWDAGERVLSDGRVLTWKARDPNRVRPVSGANCNRLLAALRRAFSLGKEKCGLLTPLTFPHFKETARGEYIEEDQCLAICEHYQAKQGAAVKADVFRLAYLLGVRKGQLRRTCKRHVIIRGDQWRLSWPAEETKSGKKTGRPHEILLVDEPLAIVQRAWANRLPDCDLLFHVDGEPLGSMLGELKRTCELLGIPYGRGKGIVFHDTRHSAVTNFVAASVPETVAMTISDHADANVFRRYNVRRDDVQADALAKQTEYLAQQRGLARRPTPLPRVGG